MKLDHRYIYACRNRGAIVAVSANTADTAAIAPLLDAFNQALYAKDADAIVKAGQALQTWGNANPSELGVLAGITGRAADAAGEVADQALAHFLGVLKLLFGLLSYLSKKAPAGGTTDAAAAINLALQGIRRR